MGRLELNQKPMYYLNDDNRISADLFMKTNTFAFAASYAGMTLEQIANWYPEPITVGAVIDYLIQEHEFEIIENIFAYMDNPILANDDIAAKLGLLDFCTYADWLSHRVCFIMYAGTDTWMLLNNNEKKTRYQRINHTNYKIDDYLEYITELEGGDKRYITKAEFEQFLTNSKTHSNHGSLYNQTYSVDSLFFALFQHGEEYGYDFDKIVDEVLVKEANSGANLGIANDFLKYYDFLEENCEGANNILTKSNVIYHFFEKSSVEHYKEMEKQQKQAELDKIATALKKERQKQKENERQKDSLRLDNENDDEDNEPSDNDLMEIELEDDNNVNFKSTSKSKQAKEKLNRYSSITKEMKEKFKNKRLMHFQKSKNKIRTAY